MLPILDINQIPRDLSGLSDSEAVALCELLRARIIDAVSRTGGHLASSLGAVELIVAIHRVFRTEGHPAETSPLSWYS